jgi:hypothetical protein
MKGGDIMDDLGSGVVLCDGVYIPGSGIAQTVFCSNWQLSDDSSVPVIAAVNSSSVIVVLIPADKMKSMSVRNSCPSGMTNLDNYTP